MLCAFGGGWVAVEPWAISAQGPAAPRPSSSSSLRGELPGRWGWEAGTAPAPGAMAYKGASLRPADRAVLQPRLAGYGGYLDAEQYAIMAAVRSVRLRPHTSSWVSGTSHAGYDLQQVTLGCTNDLPARIAKHNAGKGARYTRSRLPVTVVWNVRVKDRSAALSREAKVKQLTRAEKLELAARKKRRG